MIPNLNYGVQCQHCDKHEGDRSHTRTSPRVVRHALEIGPASDRFCTCCEKPLSGKVAWLELDQRTNTYHDRGGVPEEKSQGWFPFGLTCARTLLSASTGETK